MNLGSDEMAPGSQTVQAFSFCSLEAMCDWIKPLEQAFSVFEDKDNTLEPLTNIL